MGIRDWFRSKKPSVSLPQLCYDVAYFILPGYAYGDVAKVADLCLTTPDAAGPFFYVMACVTRKIEPVIEDAKRFRWHHGRIADKAEFFVLEYPTPPPIDISDADIDKVLNAGEPIVLAPHFSAILHDGANNSSTYYVLGQAPMGGGTTLRHVSSDGTNSNLGPGPQPVLSEFLAAVEGTA